MQKLIKSFLVSGILVLKLLILFHGNAAADPSSDENTIIWFEATYPGYYIHEGKDTGNGVADNLGKFLRERLPEYNHKIDRANMKRIMLELQNGKHGIFLTLLKKPEREKFLQFSTLTSVKPSNGIITLKKNLPLFSNKTHISVAELLDNRNLRTGVMAGRSYGKWIDPFLEEHKGEPHIIVRYGKDGVIGLIEMMLRGRIDYLVGYPHEAYIIADDMGIGDRIVTMTVKGQPPLSYSYTACPKNEWGRKLIKRINQINKE